MIDTYVMVTHEVVGFHRWPQAAEVLPERAYLADRHRHLFGIKLTLPVTHTNRDLEFHDVKTWLATLFDIEHEFGDSSCEDIATDIINRFEQRTRAIHIGRITCEVWEDWENGAKVVKDNRRST